MCKWVILSVKVRMQFSEKRRELPYIVIVASTHLPTILLFPGRSQSQYVGSY